MNTLSIEKVSPVLGASIRGLDLSAPLSADQAQRVLEAFHEHKVLILREQNIGHDKLEAFARLFGEPCGHPLAQGMPNAPSVNELRADEKSTSAFGETWHSDMTSEAEPPKATLLRLAQLPPDGGGDTLFADMCAAFDALSDPMKSFLEGLTARHDSGVFERKYGRGEGMPAAVHPVIRTHPVTKRKALYVNVRFTLDIVELKPGESRAVLEHLFRHVAETPDFQYRHKWTRDDLVLWDNRCTQHCAIFDYWPHTRVGYRVTLRGERPYFAR